MKSVLLLVNNEDLPLSLEHLKAMLEADPFNDYNTRFQLCNLIIPRKSAAYKAMLSRFAIAINKFILKKMRSPEGVKAQHICDSKQVTTNNPKICHKKVKRKEKKCENSQKLLLIVF